LEGDTNIHRITRLGALMVARKTMTIREVIRAHPEMPPIEIEEN
jgi:hypothetical protein